MLWYVIGYHLVLTLQPRFPQLMDLDYAMGHVGAQINGFRCLSYLKHPLIQPQYTQRLRLQHVLVIHLKQIHHLNQSRILRLLPLEYLDDHP